MVSKILTSLTLATLGLVMAYGQSRWQLPGCSSEPNWTEGISNGWKRCKPSVEDPSVAGKRWHFNCS
jgi:hypothetical protein